jgi:hypothetical protein
MATVIRAGPSASAASSFDAIAPTNIPTEPDTNDSACCSSSRNKQHIHSNHISMMITNHISMSNMRVQRGE